MRVDPDRRERFEREALAAASLNHPNIVTIHSVEEERGIPFLTLELIDGQTLADLIPEGGLPLDRVLTLAIPLADAVGAAHQRGITHRDLKPANIMVTSDGRVKVLDFGLAKLKEDARLMAEAGMPTAALTGDGRIVGTVAYMSPEQAEGKPVDQRSDVFSLGVMLYEMATGSRPFTGETQMSILSAILKDSPRPITDVKRGLPRDFSRIVTRCLSKDVEDRYQSAKDVRNDLRALKNDLTSGELVPVSTAGETVAIAPLRSVSRGFILGAVVAVVIVSVVAAFILRARTPAGVSEAAARPFDSIGLTRLTTTGMAGMAAISGDGGTWPMYRQRADNRACGCGRLRRRATSRSCRRRKCATSGSRFHRTVTTSTTRPTTRVPTSACCIRLPCSVAAHGSSSKISILLSAFRQTASDSRFFAAIRTSGRVR